MIKLPLNDNTNGYRFRNSFVKGIYRKRLVKKRYGITKGKTFRAFHIGKRSIYIEQFKPIRATYRWVPIWASDLMID